MKNNDLTQGSILKTIMIFFLPVAAGNIVQQLYNTVDSLIVGGHLGTNALAAVGGSPAYIVALIVGFCIALTAGASVVVSHYYGAKDSESIRKASATGIIICFIIGLGVALAGVLATPAMLRFMGTPEETLENAIVYLRVIFCGAPFVIEYNMCAGIIRASGDSRRPFIYLLVSSLTNIVLDYIFVISFEMGVFGAAFATVISQLISCLLSMVRMFRASEDYRVCLGDLKIDSFNLKKMMMLGIPTSVQVSMYNVSNTWIMAFVNSLGTVAVAGWTLTGKIDGVYWSLINACGTSVLTFVGQNYGAGRIDRVRECAKKSLAVFTLGTVVLSAFLLFISPIVLPYFDKSQEVQSTTMYMLWCFIPFYFLWPTVEVFSNVLRGVGDAVKPVIILGITICAYRIVWMYTAFRIYHTLAVLCSCYAISWLMAGTALFIRYKRGEWNKVS